jgi:hypothetical protein
MWRVAIEYLADLAKAGLEQVIADALQGCACFV